MAIIKVKTKNQSNIARKPRVYFTCHPEDFEKYFRKICDDIFATHDCAIYYTEDMMSPIPEEDRETDLGRHNLFVVPVTLNLLTTPNRAMDVDIPYAREAHIPMLPMMMEPGLDVIYARKDKFGELQYLTPNSADTTEISYADKLKKYLEAVLISDAMAKRIRAAFDAYIFLSYRKKDRRYANELMRLIHNIPQCRDIAIWFDEFLIPGESFRESIGKILRDSKLFALLVTPNLLEEPEGKPNFVMAEEYPAADRSGIPILPTEMEETDREALCKKFPNIPDCIKTSDETFQARLLETVAKLATKENDTPEHNYLIGLAYLEGIDVEVNRAHALALITAAAEAGLPEAMEKLFRMYDEGIGVALDYRKAVVWAQKLADYRMAHNGEAHPETLTALHHLSYTYGNLGAYRRALELLETVYRLRCKVQGAAHPETLTALNNLAYLHSHLGNHRKALELDEKGYVLRCNVLGQEHPHTLISLNNLAYTYGQWGDHGKALELKEKVYALRCKVLGPEHPDTLVSLNNLAYAYGRLGDHRRALELHEKVYHLRLRLLGQEHPDTLLSLYNLATTYGQLGFYDRALELSEMLYPLSCKVLGPEHPDTLLSLNHLATAYGQLGFYDRAFELNETLYALSCKVLGPEHPDTMRILWKLANTCSTIGQHRQALEWCKKLYPLRSKVLGPEHPDTLTCLSHIGVCFFCLGEYQDALDLLREVYALRCKVLGENHPDTLRTMEFITLIHCNLS